MYNSKCILSICPKETKQIKDKQSTYTQYHATNK